MAKKKTKTREVVAIVPTIQVAGSIGGELKSLMVEPNDTIRSIMEKAGFSVTDGTEVICRQTAESVSLDQKPINQYIYYLSQKYKSLNLD
jgi:hypothetical protein